MIWTDLLDLQPTDDVAPRRNDEPGAIFGGDLERGTECRRLVAARIGLQPKSVTKTEAAGSLSLRRARWRRRRLARRRGQKEAARYIHFSQILLG